MELQNKMKKIKLSDAIAKYLIHLQASNFASNTFYCYSKDLKLLKEKFGDIYHSN